ncbi:hypothetical protein [Rhodohalobacter sulfatireducens]|uniref:Uncharacterized protein n=1 Tax=Rhodohalobacter sulfatireducens TaxID=2911366 RepID=A0ABS9K859_9BACT|nr:hypothetical protein [Rhodohalobacter sulfatireducens]MCG2587041.1 hypothetical protein [Rhodohalobacter sulfatireducens]
MWKKIKTYLRFWKNKPSYHIEGSAYGGLRMDIDKYYSLEENKKELEELNKTFEKFFEKEINQEEKGSSSVTKI